MQEIKVVHTVDGYRIIIHLNNTCCTILIQNKIIVLEYVLIHYTLRNEVRVIEGKIIKKMT